jgi:GWxTD domain-containing protein
MLLLILSSSIAQAQSVDITAQRLYKNAKMSTISQDWDQAANLYKKVIDDYPQSRYNDESQFWLGFCLEKEKDKGQEAFDAFEQLVVKSPNSPWADDAISRQIRLAEQFVNQGDESYRKYLSDKLGHDEPQMRHESALALGRLGDKASLPLLKEMREKDEYVKVVTPIINELEIRYSTSAETNVNIDKELQPFGKAQSAKNVKNIGKDLHYYSEKRFDQYHNMTRQSNDWWDDELYSFGMWHIVPSDSFDSFISLPPQKQKVWYNIYWKKNDPTPTSQVNEAQIEFERRVKYARQHYDYYDELEGFFYAPWDARGEIYIKYGEPKSRKKDAYREFWYYPLVNHIRFMIKPNVTNIFGRAIFLEGRSISRNRVDAEKMRNDFIFMPKFHFAPAMKDAIKDISIRVESMKEDNRLVRLKYQLPIKELKMKKANNLYKVEYRQSYIIYDSHMNEILRQENVESLTDQSKTVLINKMHIKQAIQLDLKPGRYTIALQIEDRWSKKAAVKSIDFNVRI